MKIKSVVPGSYHMNLDDSNYIFPALCFSWLAKQKNVSWTWNPSWVKHVLSSKSCTKFGSGRTDMELLTERNTDPPWSSGDTSASGRYQLLLHVWKFVSPFRSLLNFGTSVTFIRTNSCAKNSCAFRLNKSWKNLRGFILAHLSQNFKNLVLIFSKFRANWGSARKCAKICPRENYE